MRLISFGHVCEKRFGAPAGNHVAAPLSRRVRTALIAASVLAVSPASAETGHLTVDGQGTITQSSIELPVSEFLSPQGRAMVKAELARNAASQAGGTIEEQRRGSDLVAKAQLDQWLAIHPATIESKKINGVRVDIVTPQGGVSPRNAHRVLINAHMGRFLTGARYGGALEAVPLASAGHVKIVAVDYRMAPEYGYPAALEDVETVYRELLKTYKPEAIGIYGCSAGGAISAEMISWLERRHLPPPGAIGLFCSGAMRGFWRGGDSETVGPFASAITMPGRGASPAAPAPRGYFDGIDQNDPKVTPGLSLDYLRRFPPTLLVTGTRDIALSNASTTYGRLLEAGVDAQLFVQEGMGHGQFASFAGAPEAETAYRVIWRFFDSHLGPTARTKARARR